MNFTTVICILAGYLIFILSSILSFFESKEKQNESSFWSKLNRHCGVDLKASVLLWRMYIYLCSISEETNSIDAGHVPTLLRIPEQRNLEELDSTYKHHLRTRNWPDLLKYIYDYDIDRLPSEVVAIEEDVSNNRIFLHL